MSKRIDDLKFGAIIEAISQISPVHGQALSVTMDLIDQRETERVEKELEHLEKQLTAGFLKINREANNEVDKIGNPFVCIVIIYLLLLLFSSNSGSFNMF